jgi:hypothetical protein
MNTTAPTASDAPKSLRDPTAVAARRAMLPQSHMRPLTEYVTALRLANPDWEFPDFDPLDGGVEADMLFLLEKPGPMTSPRNKRVGSGFISRDNDDPTAAATFQFMRIAGIDRCRTVLWNTVPGWNGKRAITPHELAAGVDEVCNLLKLLPRVRTVVLVGRKAQRAEPHMITTGMRIFRSAHPSMLVRNRYPDVWRRIPDQWADAAANL